MRESKKASLINMHILCKTMAEMPVFYSADVARNLSLSPSSSTARLIKGIGYKLISINRTVYPHQYAILSDWESRLIELSGVDFSEIAAESRGIISAPVVAVKQSREDAYAMRKRHGDEPSESACLHRVWGWVRPACGVLT